MLSCSRAVFLSILDARSIAQSEVWSEFDGVDYWIAEKAHIVYFGLTIDNQFLMFASKGGPTFWQAPTGLSRQVMSVDSTWIEKGRGTLHDALEELAEKFKKDMAYSVKPQRGSSCLSVQFC